MVHSSGGMMHGTCDRLRGKTGVFIRLVRTLLFVLSTATMAAMAAMTNTAQAQSGGALGGLLNQLQTLQGSGAIDALEGPGPSNLNTARRQGSAAIAKLRAESAAGTLKSAEELLVRRGNLSNKQRLFAEKFCRGTLEPAQLPAIGLIKQFSPLEKD